MGRAGAEGCREVPPPQEAERAPSGRVSSPSPALPRNGGGSEARVKGAPYFAFSITVMPPM